jgi:hypothetical protein
MSVAMPHLILIVIVLVALVLLVRWLFRSPEATFGALPVTSIGEVKDGETCKLIGTVSLAPGEDHVLAPFSGREALVCVARLFRDGETDEAVKHLRAVPCFRVEDATGSALIRPLPAEGDDLEPSLTLAADGETVLRLLPMEPVDAFLEAVGRTRQSLEIANDASELPDQLSIAENVLREGDRVVVVGWCSHGEGEEMPRVGPKKGKLLFISNDQNVILEMVRGAMSSAKKVEQPGSANNSKS